MKILVTGANGYLGQGIIHEILEKGHEVIAVDLSVDRIDQRAKKVKINFFDVKSPYDFFNKPDVLVHLAWREGFVHDSIKHIEDLPKHFNFIKSLAESGIQKIVVMGSMHEIGFYEGCIHEDTPSRPMNYYGISKAALKSIVEHLAEIYKIKYQWLRGYYIVGTSKEGSSIFSKIAIAESGGKKEFPFTSGKNQYDFLDYDEFCNQVAATVCQDEINGVIDICSGWPEKLSDRVEKFIKDNQYHIKLKYGAYPDRPYDSKAVWGDNRKILKILKKDK